MKKPVYETGFSTTTDKTKGPNNRDYIMNSNLAYQITQRYCCARCWGHLINFPDSDGGLHPTCARSLSGECDGKGYVTKTYAERRRQESLAELMEVYANYPQLRPAHPAWTEEKILAYLGF